MARVSKHQSELNREFITETSARLFRERGISGVSVAELMAEAGLTHGGFYGHFQSKEALADIACARAFASSVERWKRRVADAHDKDAARLSIIDAFLSNKSRSAPGQACPTATLAVDVAREPIEAPIRATFAAGLEALAEILESLEGGKESLDRRREALADFATLVGAQILARATSQGAISDELLSAARVRLHDRRRS